MRSEIVPLADLAPRDFGAWKELAAAAISPNPFMEPDFVVPASQVWNVRDVGILVTRDGGDWVAAVPVRETRSWRGMPGHCLLAWRHDYCYLGTPLIAGDDPMAAMAAIVDYGVRVGRCLALEWIDADGPLLPAMSEAFSTVSRLVVLNQFERAAQHRVDGEIKLRASSSARKALARRRRQLEREVGLLTTREASTDPRAYQTFLEIERAGWKGELGTAMACRPGHSEFFIDLCSRFAEMGRLQMLSLANDEHTVAMRCDLAAGDILYHFKGCFDEKFERNSPGIQLELEAADYVSAREFRLVDSCTAEDNSTLNRLWPARRQIQTVVACGRGVSAAPTYAKWRAVVATRSLRERRSGPPPPPVGRGH
jgi:CelD/BcsL family acetyltransferase involved in cellulose biosynthesis